MIFFDLRLSAIKEFFFAWCDKWICFHRLALAKARLETVKGRRAIIQRHTERSPLSTYLQYVCLAEV